MNIKAGMYCMTSAHDFCFCYNLHSVRQSESADFGKWELTDFTENRVVYDAQTKIIFFLA